MEKYINAQIIEKNDKVTALRYNEDTYYNDFDLLSIVANIESVEQLVSELMTSFFCGVNPDNEKDLSLFKLGFKEMRGKTNAISSLISAIRQDIDRLGIEAYS